MNMKKTLLVILTGITLAAQRLQQVFKSIPEVVILFILEFINRLEK